MMMQTRNKFNSKLSGNASLQDHAFAGYKKLIAGESASGDFAGFFTLEDSTITASAFRGDDLTAEDFPAGMYIPFQTRNISCSSGRILVAYNV